MRLKAFAEIYTMHSFAQLCNLIFCQNNLNFANYFAGNPPLILPGGVFAGDARCNRTEDEQLVALVKKRNLT